MIWDLENEKRPANSLPLLQKILDKNSLSKMSSIEEIQSFHVDQIKSLPAKFLDLDFKGSQSSIARTKGQNLINLYSIKSITATGVNVLFGNYENNSSGMDKWLVDFNYSWF
jgi:hypothetical protein